MPEVTLLQVVDQLERLYPLEYSESWDHPGLIVGNIAQPVHTIAFAVDPTLSVVQLAIEQGADLLVCHHPLLFQSVHQVSELDPHGQIIAMLYEHHCGLWVGHTNADSAWRGVAHAAADAFGLRDMRPIVPIAVGGQRHDDAQTAESDDVDDRSCVGLGRVGMLDAPMTLLEFAKRVAAVLPFTAAGIQVAGDPHRLIQRVAVLPGSGDSLFDEVRDSGADVYVTSDLRHHPATDALEYSRNQCFIEECKAQHDAAHCSSVSRTCSSLSYDCLDGDEMVSSSAFALINTAHSAIESLWFRYALDDVAHAILAVHGVHVTTTIIQEHTDPWTFTLPTGNQS